MENEIPETAEPHACEIYPKLWLGDLKAATDTDFLRNNKIKCIINCTSTLPFTDISDISKYRVPVKDNLQIDQIYLMYTLLDKAVKLIFQHLQSKDGAVLVHCHAGRQRSVSVIVAFCMKCANMTKDEALMCVQTKREVAGMPQLNFDRALTEYEKSLKQLFSS